MNEMIKNKQTVKFDPGIGQLFEDFNTFVNDVYSQLMSFRSIAQKRIRFRTLCNKIYSKMENNILFYYGCLLWAYYIKTQNKSSAREIEGNPFLSYTNEEIENYDFLLQVNFIENYFDSFERDTQYYIGKKFSIPKNWVKILNLYKEFLELNKGFVKTKTTADLIIPTKLKEMSFDFDIEKAINRVVEEKNLKLLPELKWE